MTCSCLRVGRNSGRFALGSPSSPTYGGLRMLPPGHKRVGHQADHYTSAHFLVQDIVRALTTDRVHDRVPTEALVILLKRHEPWLGRLVRVNHERPSLPEIAPAVVHRSAVRTQPKTTPDVLNHDPDRRAASRGLLDLPDGHRAWLRAPCHPCSRGGSRPADESRPVCWSLVGCHGAR